MRTRLALVGAGNFGHFVAGAAAAAADVELVAVADADPAAAQRLSRAAIAPARSVEQLLADEDVDAVAIVTPPHTHFALAQRALAAGKDVFCEKPLGGNQVEANALRDNAIGAGRVLVVDHVLRYNPLLAAVRAVQDELGLRPVRFLFENDAADESLPADHWFWDEHDSGGIFIEHGVHFFDAARMFVDVAPTSVVAAATRRSGWPAPDLVSATVLHGDCLATHTHSFTHAHRAERQLMRIDLGSAEARIAGWIPVEAELDVFTDEAGERAVRVLLSTPGLLDLPGHAAPPDAVRITSTDGGAPVARGRGVSFAASRRVGIRLSLGGEPAKQQVYAASVAAALQDLHACRVGRSRAPRSNATTAAEAVALAEAATTAAVEGRAVELAASAHLL
ncbi:Gfo/Idh/MocA family oxidoreductase [Calidifontibacter sp. DB0510]|uniref:Gfo/Idh/MocA family oxidoreductase n=1 Tax=Metallococcus carri TaxID=1656884 RepID=A0A967B8V4_9MICO|nr:Gfo/Idh/MocA family oxidoreductase [Metallococcus carri]NHN56951.1 Gfo/Idh/MocA family oxidoreductase [Metallococcus carri]NOP37696.1 Gfo/Idh/MocA family oxidoreductase [Calidifontibacter sp. DB2511S]